MQQVGRRRQSPSLRLACPVEGFCEEFLEPVSGQGLEVEEAVENNHFWCLANGPEQVCGRDLKSLERLDCLVVDGLRLVAWERLKLGCLLHALQAIRRFDWLHLAGELDDPLAEAHEDCVDAFLEGLNHLSRQSRSSLSAAPLLFGAARMHCVGDGCEDPDEGHGAAGPRVVGREALLLEDGDHGALEEPHGCELAMLNEKFLHGVSIGRVGVHRPHAPNKTRKLGPFARAAAVRGGEEHGCAAPVRA
mmetsp:Transcript_23859/g.69898  ORF Transcript_23859/g.69898 Transcript_23859/m.69898 type:complete len:248 (-) Transcript_23859:796-1539(-)